MKALAESGVKRMAVVAPGFSADCLETLEELDGENREIFEHHGGEAFAYLPCLNDSADGIRVIRHLVERELQGLVVRRPLGRALAAAGGFRVTRDARLDGEPRRGRGRWHWASTSSWSLCLWW